MVLGALSPAFPTSQRCRRSPRLLRGFSRVLPGPAQTPARRELWPWLGFPRALGLVLPVAAFQRGPGKGGTCRVAMPVTRECPGTQGDSVCCSHSIMTPIQHIPAGYSGQTYR